MTRAQYAVRPRRESLTKRLGALGRRLVSRGHGRCVYCGATEGPMHLDHVVPRSQGGADAAENIVLSCASCNGRKQDMSLNGFMRYLRTVMGWSREQTTSCLRRVHRQRKAAV